MAISTVNVDFSAILQNAAQATGLLRVRLSQVGTVEDSETGDTVILPIAWQETTLTDGAATLALVPNKIIEPSCTYYEIQLKSVPDCPKACAKLLLSGIMYVPDEDCNVLDLLISPPSPETANTASGYASQAKQAAQVAENFAIQAGDRYDDVAEAAATALTDIGTAKQDALDAIGTAQSGATEAISTAEDAALQAIGQARGTALDDIGTAQGTAIGAVQAEGNTQVGRVYDAGEDTVADVTAAQATAVSAVQAQQATSVAAVSAEGTAQVNAVTQAGNGYIATMQGLVSDAQAARDAAQTAQGLAEDAQAAAESASTDAQGYAGDASTSAGQAAQSASDAADSATAAQASAESIAASAEQIQTNERNVSNIQALLNGTLYREETDSTAAYSKSVPTGALPYASINEIGGKTVVWNQNNNSQYTSGINGTLKNGASGVAADGVLTLLAVQAGEIYQGSNYYNMRQNHIYYYSVQAKVATAQTDNVIIIQPFSAISLYVKSTSFTTFSGLYTYPNTAQRIYYPRIFDNRTSGWDEIQVTPVAIVDLTQMFGAGNEPASVAEFEAMFPSIDPAYNAGELRSAGVTEAVSEGRNLVGVAGRTLGTTTEGNPTVAKQWDTSKFYLGCTSNGAYLPSYITSYSIDGDKVSCVATSPGYGIGVPVKLTKGETYRITVYSDDAYQCQGIAFYNKDGYYVSTSYTASNAKTISFVMPSDAEIALVVYRAGNVGTVTPPVTLTNCYIMLERGSTATEYTPYRSPISLPIPSAIQSLPGYGWSAGTAYNYVDFERKVYVQNVGSVDLGTLNWTYESGTQRMSSGYITGMKKSAARTVYMICPLYVTKDQGEPYDSSWNMVIYNNANVNTIYVHNHNYTDAASFKAAMSSVMLYYELATPIETDISSLLTDSTIEVEAGGTLTFKNQHGDDWRVPVPNEETFLVQATPELPTTDGTYTLQCTVTDGTPSVTWVTA